LTPIKTVWFRKLGLFKLLLSLAVIGN